MTLRFKIPRRLARADGFTLLELCIVLCIIALLAGLVMPAMNSAFTEQSLRADSHRLALMARTAMIASREQQRPFVMKLDGNRVALQPQAAAIADTSGLPAPRDVAQTETVANVLQFPDAEKKDGWETLPTVSWTFEPDGLCPLPRLRLQRGAAYIEMSFNALTGGVEDESVSLP